jgi:DNA-binding PadR family transcriptional regulator
MIFFYSTFKRLMIPLLPQEFVVGRLLRARFNEVSGRTISIGGFYIWMRRLEKEGAVEIKDAKDSDGKILLFRKINDCVG